MKKMTASILCAVSPLLAKTPSVPDSVPESAQTLVYEVGANFIYWQAIEENLEPGELALTPTGVNPSRYKELVPDFAYLPGFQVRLGLSNQALSTWFEYTRLHASQSERFSPGDGESISPYWVLGTGVAVNALHQQWDLDYDVLSWTIKTKQFCQKSWSFLPYIGIKGGWIHQKLEQNDQPILLSVVQPYFAQQLYHSNSWLLGPGAGIQSSANLGYGFSFLLSADFYLLYQPYTISSKNQSLSAPTQWVYDTYEPNCLTQNMDISLGFVWKKGLSSDRYFIELGAGYDFLYYSDQSLMRKMRALVYGADGGTLIFQGLNVSGKLYW